MSCSYLSLSAHSATGFTQVRYMGALFRGGRGLELAFFVLATVVGLMALSSQSLWVDEAYTAHYVRQANLAEAWSELVRIRGSDLQMPLYMGWMWGWTRVLGTGEWALRAANVPWFAVGLWGLLWGIRCWRQEKIPVQVGMAMTTLVSPFLWYYLDEARPYAMQFAGGALLAGWLTRVIGAPNTVAFRRDAVGAGPLGVLLAGVIVTAGSSALGVPWAGMVLVTGALAMLTWHKRLPRRRLAIVSILAMGVLAGWTAYYLWARSLGGGAATLGFSPASVGFALYEFLGFTGLGPGRLVLREVGPSALGKYAVPIGALVIAFGLLALCSLPWIVGVIARQRKQIGFWGVYLAGPLATLALAAMLADLRLLGRHLMPAYPVFLLALGWVIGVAMGANKSGATEKSTCCSLSLGPIRFASVVAVGFLGVWLASALMVRFSDRHLKDDYRGAASWASEQLASGKTVWWAASKMGAEYYGLIPTAWEDRLRFLSNPSEVEIAALPLSIREPDAIILSKRDLYDARGALGDFLELESYVMAGRLPAFTLWRNDEDLDSR